MTGPNEISRPVVVVGWDGSTAARAAVATAARLARGGTIVAVHAHEPIAPHVTARWHELLELDAAERSAALLRELPEAAIGGLGPEAIVPVSVAQPPTKALLEQAHRYDAAAIAVGSRGIGVTTAITGGVSAELLRTADRPVLVIPPAAVAHLQEQVA